VNKKQAKVMKKGYSEAGQMYWTDEMATILRKKNAELRAYRFGLIFALAFAAGVAFQYARAFW
jgi:hypothetical protein